MLLSRVAGVLLLPSKVAGVLFLSGKVAGVLLLSSKDVGVPIGVLLLVDTLTVASDAAPSVTFPFDAF